MAVVLGCFCLKCLFNAFPRVQREVLEKGAKSIVLASHLGRPDGSVAARRKQEFPDSWSWKVSEVSRFRIEVEKFSMAPVAKILEETNPCHENSVIGCGRTFKIL